MIVKRIISLALCVLPFIHAYAQDPIRTASTIRVEATDTDGTAMAKAAHVVPSPRQLEAMKNEFIAFVHFGPNTFTGMEWGNGMESPKIFDLKALDTDQWCEAMAAAGMKMVVLTAKHHDGFVLWQSRYTAQGIMSADFRGGKGDIMRDLSESCRKYGLKLGVYLSPADLYQIEHPDGLYGNLSPYTERVIPREVPGRPFANKTKFKFVVDDYNEYFLNQLFELLTEYGPIHEVWFDGAHPKTKGGQKYNYTAWRELIRTLAPDATIFGREDIRWCGNEGAYTRDSEWNVISPYTEDPAQMKEFWDLYGDLGTRESILGKERPFYLHYQPAETNTSIREGWFYRDDTHQRSRNADDVFDIYERSVGGNSIFLLNIPPNREGLFSPQDVDVLKEVGKRIRETYDTDLLNGAEGPEEVLDHNPDTYSILTGTRKEIAVTLPKPSRINRVMLQEAVATHSERVEKYAVDIYADGAWTEVAKGTNIGYKHIVRFPETTAEKLRLRILDSRFDPAISHFSAHYYRPRPLPLQASRNADGLVVIDGRINDFTWSNWANTEYYERLESRKGSESEIRYTVDGSEPDADSPLYTGPFALETGLVKAVPFMNGERGPLMNQRVPYARDVWKGMSGIQDGIGIDMGAKKPVIGFAYMPAAENTYSIVAGTVQVSDNGKRWKTIGSFTFGNLTNDPSTRIHYFEKPLGTRYIRIIPSENRENGAIVSTENIDIY